MWWQGQTNCRKKPEDFIRMAERRQIESQCTYRRIKGTNLNCEGGRKANWLQSSVLKAFSWTFGSSFFWDHVVRRLGVLNSPWGEDGGAPVQVCSLACPLEHLDRRGKSDLTEELHDGDGGALAKDEGSTDEGHDPPNGEDDSGEETVQVLKRWCKRWCKRSNSDINLQVWLLITVYPLDGWM